jgi:hypothetical protein
MAFGCFTLAVVLEGIYARFEHHGLAVPSHVARAHQVPGADD